MQNLPRSNVHSADQQRREGRGGKQIIKAYFSAVQWSGPRLWDAGELCLQQGRFESFLVFTFFYTFPVSPNFTLPLWLFPELWKMATLTNTETLQFHYKFSYIFCISINCFVFIFAFLYKTMLTFMMYRHPCGLKAAGLVFFFKEGYRDWEWGFFNFGTLMTPRYTRLQKPNNL